MSVLERTPTLDRSDAARQMIQAHRVIRQWWAKHFLPGRTHKDLTWTQFMILDLALEDPTINISQIAQQLDLSSPTVVRAAGTLVKKGLVQRCRPSEHRRDITIEVTSEGRAAHRLIAAFRLEQVQRMFATLDDDSVRTLLKSYTGLAEAAARDTS
jgi:DNA-binding MarR family transcriptional regulator